MKVIEMGNLGLAEGMTGVLIEATKNELQQIANLLYEDVKIVSVGTEKTGNARSRKKNLSLTGTSTGKLNATTKSRLCLRRTPAKLTAIKPS